MENKVVLLVEDNAGDEELTLRALKKCGIADEIIVTRDGAEALEYLFATDKFEGRDTTILPQLMLLDLKMPKMDGLKVLQRLRADDRTKSLPVVVFTSSSEPDDMIQSYDLGANSYVRKPVDFETFTEAIRELGKYWLTLNQIAPAEIG